MVDMLRINRNVLILLGLVMNLCACSLNSDPKLTGSVEKILFVGNSFTFVHGGVDMHLRELAASAIPPDSFQVDSKLIPGATLAVHYEQSDVREVIRDGFYDVVILQEDIPEITERSIEPFFEYARLLDQEIKETGSKTMFFMTWAYERLNWVTLEEIVEAHAYIGAELNATIAPVGVAFQRSLEKRSDMAMLLDDKEHESLHGTYLAACVIYSSLFQKSPVGLAYVPTGVSIEESVFLQGIAWETVQEWNDL